jgi:hypothetical protein
VPAVRVQYGVLPYRFTQMAALEILIGYDATIAAVDRTQGLADQEADAFEVRRARSVRGSRRQGQNWRKTDRAFQIQEAAKWSRG